MNRVNFHHKCAFLRLSIVSGWCFAVVIGLAWPAIGLTQESTTDAVVAGPTPKLFVVDAEAVGGDVSRIIPQRIGATLTQHLQTDSRVDVLPSLRETLRRMQGGQNASSAVAEAQRMYMAGIGLLSAEEYERATDMLSRAVEIMEQNLTHLHNFDALIDAIANLALAYFHAGFDLDARRSIQKYAQLRPDTTLDAERFPRALQSLFRDEVQKIKRAGEGVLEVSSDVTGAIIYLNGEMKGEAPMSIEGVTFGTHYLVVRDQRSGRAVNESARVRGRGQTDTIHVELMSQSSSQTTGRASQEDDLPSFYLSLRDRLRTGRFGEELSPYFQELARQTNAQFVSWVLVVREGQDYVVTPFVYRISDEALLQLEATKFNRDLSNLRVQVSAVTEFIAQAVVEMPVEKRVKRVELVPEAPRDSAVSSIGSQQASSPHAATQATSSPHSQSLAPPPNVDTSETRSNTWKYVGWGGAAVLVGGIIAGSIYLLSQDEQPTSGFATEVRW